MLNNDWPKHPDNASAANAVNRVRMPRPRAALVPWNRRIQRWEGVQASGGKFYRRHLEAPSKCGGKAHPAVVPRNRHGRRASSRCSIATDRSFSGAMWRFTRVASRTPERQGGDGEQQQRVAQDGQEHQRPTLQRKRQALPGSRHSVSSSSVLAPIEPVGNERFQLWFALPMSGEPAKLREAAPVEVASTSREPPSLERCGSSPQELWQPLRQSRAVEVGGSLAIA
jgi:hypothetical protein